MSQVNGNQFLPAELITMRHYDKKSGKWNESDYPKVGGRLRLAHELNGTLDISTEIIQYDGNVAVVKSLCTTDKGSYTGISMASLERDTKIAPAILELAETRAIARSLRFAGYGVEYCSAEEVSHLDHEKENTSYPPIENDPFSPDPDGTLYCPSSPVNMRRSDGGGGAPGSSNKSSNAHSTNGNSTNHHGTNGNGGNETSRLSQKQHSFLLHLADERDISRKELDDMSRERFGSVVSFLSKGDASSLIGEMTSN